MPVAVSERRRRDDVAQSGCAELEGEAVWPPDDQVRGAVVDRQC